jgi:Zn-dependent oligopeptidase
MNAPTFNLTTEQMNSVYDTAVSTFERVISNIIAVDKEARNFSNTVLAFENATSDFSDYVNIPIFMAYVSQNPEIRKAGSELELKISQYLVDVFTREDIFNALNEYANKQEKLNDVDKKLLDKILFEFKQNGLGLPKNKREKVKKLLKELINLQLEFSKNLREVNDYIEVDESQLKGLGEDYKNRLKKTESGKYIVTTNYPDYMPFMDNAEDAESRKKLEFIFNNRCSDKNVELMEKAIKIRGKIAKLLGYKNFADYALVDRMAKNSETVFKFLTDLQKAVVKKGKKELKERIKIKNKISNLDEKILHNWEWRYYNNLIRKQNYELDHEKIKEYFPLDNVINGMFEIFGAVFGVKFQPVNLDKWNNDVRSYEVKDISGKTFAYFYFDLFPREGKYKHAACFSIRSGRRLEGNIYQLPAAAIVANFTPPSNDIPSLLKFDDVVTLFHEFGHVTHNIFTKSDYGKFSGTNVARDFVEVPSKMLENWAYYPQVLKKISGHYKTGEKLPDETIKKIIDSKNFDSGLFYLRQLFFSILDIKYHTKNGKVDTTSIYEKLMKKIFMIPMTPLTHPQASFGHLMGGYEAGYYSYLWSEVIAMDLFSEFEKNGILNYETGKKYIDLILSPGGSLDELSQVKKFLGRDISNDAFLSSIGVKLKENTNVS